MFTSGRESSSREKALLGVLNQGAVQDASVFDVEQATIVMVDIDDHHPVVPFVDGAVFGVQFTQATDDRSSAMRRSNSIR